jgi:FAD synthetase
MADKKGESKTARKIVLASGVFDLLHIGHVRFLEEAKKAGGPNSELIVIVARDSTVVKQKGIKPVVPESQRCALIGSLKVVDKSILGYEESSMGKVIEKVKPDIIALGYDSRSSGLEQAVKDVVKGKGLNVEVVRIGHFREDELDSSSKIKQKIIDDYGR